MAGGHEPGVTPSRPRAIGRSSHGACQRLRASSAQPRPNARTRGTEMARSLNKVMLIGNVGSEPEVRTTPSGLKVAKVSLATNRKFNDRSGQAQEKTEWHRLTFWDRMAELVDQYVHKGDRL